MSTKALWDLRLLSVRALREWIRSPESTLPGLLIPLFFLLVNVGQVSKVFTSSTPFLHGQTYAAFQLPLSLLFATTDGIAGYGLVQDIDRGYFDKLRATPVARSALVLGRLAATFVRGLLLGTLVCVVAMLIGVHFAGGIAGLIVLVLLTASWGVVFGGLVQLIALKTKSPAAVNSSQLMFFPLLFLTPNFVPRNLLARPMEILATYNPVTYVVEGMRSLVLEGFVVGDLLRALVVIAGLGAITLAANIRLVNRSA